MVSWEDLTQVRLDSSIGSPIRKTSPVSFRLDEDHWLGDL